MRTVKWNLIEGNKKDQETKEMKRQEGLEYIERLKQDENVLEVIETEKELIITLE